MADATEGYDNTISGLFRKRGELLGEAERLRDRIAEIRNDVDRRERGRDGANRPSAWQRP